MNKLISPLVLVATLSLTAALVAKLVPIFGEFASFICPSGFVTPNSFARLANSCALVAIALVAVEWLQAKKE